MKPTDTIDFHIRWAWHKIHRMYNNEASQNGFTMSIGYALLNIDRKEGTPSTKLGPLMGMEPRSLTRTLKSMEQQGFIERKPDKYDRRMVRIYLTDLGLEKREVSRRTVIQFNEALRDKISNADLTAFFRVMNTVNQALEKEAPLESE